MSIETYYAEMETARNEAEQAYFAARPHLDSTAARTTFCAGFERGFQKLWNERSAVETVTAQHDETGRMWEGPRDQLPPRYSVVNTSPAPKTCTECDDTRVVWVDDDGPMPCPDCCCEDCGVAPGESHYSSCSNYVTPGFEVNRKTAL